MKSRVFVWCSNQIACGHCMQENSGTPPILFAARHSIRTIEPFDQPCMHFVVAWDGIMLALHAFRGAWSQPDGAWLPVSSMNAKPLEKQYFQVCHLKASRERWEGSPHPSAPLAPPLPCRFSVWLSRVARGWVCGTEMGFRRLDGMNAGMPAEPPISPAWAMRAVMHPECGGWSVVKSLESLAGRPLEKQYFRVCHLEASREGWTGLRGLLCFLHQSPHRCSGSRSRRGAFAALAACGGRAWFGRGHGHCPAFPRRFRGGGGDCATGAAARPNSTRSASGNRTGRVMCAFSAPRSLRYGRFPHHVQSCAAAAAKPEWRRSGNTPADGNPQNRKTAKKEIFWGVSPESKQGRVGGLARAARALCRRAGCRARLRRTRGGDGMPTSPALSAGCRYDAARHAEMPVSGTSAGCGWNARNARIRHGRNRKRRETAF